MPKPDLANYVTVSERIEAFKAKHEQGSLAAEIVSDDGKRVVMKAYAYRGPEDTSPGVGHAEEIRGDGPINKTSALENCETSAWGRAIAALGFEVKKGVASREEVEQALAEESRQKQGNGRISEEDAAGLRELTKSLHIPTVAVRMKLASMNAETLDDLRTGQVEDYEKWLSDTAEKAKAA